MGTFRIATSDCQKDFGLVSPIMRMPIILSAPDAKYQLIPIVSIVDNHCGCEHMVRISQNFQLSPE